MLYWRDTVYYFGFLFFRRSFNNFLKVLHRNWLVSKFISTIWILSCIALQSYTAVVRIIETEGVLDFFSACWLRQCNDLARILDYC